MGDHVLLCLKCRGKGYVVEHCTSGTWEPELDWFFSQERRSIDLTRVGAGTIQAPCPRCEDLDLIRLLESRPLWDSQSELTEAFDMARGHDSILRLGRTGSIQFWADCPVCCCLFGITPNPSSKDQEILLLPDWTICRCLERWG